MIFGDAGIAILLYIETITCMCTRVPANVYWFGQKKEPAKSHHFYNFITDI
jgi:hypothetical protein